MRRELEPVPGCVLICGSLLAADPNVLIPAKISKDDVAGAVFNPPDMIETQHDDVDEFMYFLESRVTLTSSDGSVQVTYWADGTALE